MIDAFLITLTHLDVRIWRVLFTSLSADENQLNSKSAYISKCINMYECTSVVMSIIKPYPGKTKNHQDLCKSLHYVQYS